MSNKYGINNKEGRGLYTYDNTQINAVIKIENTSGAISSEPQTITYTAFNQPDTLKTGTAGNETMLVYTYGPDQQRIKSVLKDPQGTVLKTIVYSSIGCEKITVGTEVYEVYYLGNNAVSVRHNNQDQLFYLYTDHLGSILKVTDANGAVVMEQNFDAWGRKRDPLHLDYDFGDYPTLAIPTGTHDPEKWLIRGYTGHEHLPEFGLINMNGRLYDPVLGRMLSPDNFVQGVTSTQAYNRYSYALNNPLKYTDPDGEWVAAAVIGAVIGAYTGGVIGNDGEKNPLKWNWNAGRTYSFVWAGSSIGFASGGLSAYVGASGMAFAGTAAIATASFTSGVGYHILSGGRTPVTLGLGAASYNITQNQWGYLGKPGNTGMENVGYGLGALTNISDGVMLYDASVAAKRANMTQAEKDAQLGNYNDWRRNGDNNYVGPTGNVDPRVVRAKGGPKGTGLDPLEGVDDFAYTHDIGYYDKGADGLRGALFNTNTISDDVALVQGARGVIATNPTSMARIVNITFTGLVVFKTSYQHSYLFNIIGQ